VVGFSPTSFRLSKRNYIALEAWPRVVVSSPPANIYIVSRQSIPRVVAGFKNRNISSVKKLSLWTSSFVPRKKLYLGVNFVPDYKIKL
jgi:hypothetical protein